MANTTYRNKPFPDLNNFYIIYYEGENLTVFHDWIYRQSSISFQGPYRSLEYAKKNCINKKRGAIIYHTETRKNVFNNKCKKYTQTELFEWATKYNYINATSYQHS